MNQKLVIDGNTNQETPQLCGNALCGTDTGPCPGCQKRKALMLSGFCITCNHKRGIHPFSTNADVVAGPDKTNKE
ncbi:MAG: hypothetical protein JSS86_24115 [Cyanobacteria bacterium SZAS LIN-2]|nr:hypothetical protein [Cyanobacteria bacterium SZAS LIN-3]MBS1999443.1 hypothetical protein [Cyanobacteria bacterium SZAS LIN-2]MBS2010021.1 hypothetical protein [Cyanobacteria bacterium SZAS TMP-1]